MNGRFTILAQEYTYLKTIFTKIVEINLFKYYFRFIKKKYGKNYI